MEDVAVYCDRLTVLAGGKVFAEGSCAEVFSRYNELIGVGLDVPQVTRIASALYHRGIDIGRDVYTVGYAAGKLSELLDK